MRDLLASSIDTDKNEIHDRIKEICADISKQPATLLPQNDSDVIMDFVYGDVRCVLYKIDKTSGHVLSPREFEIARLVAAGHSNKVIAGVLDISYWTVGTHLRRIFSKYNVTSRAAMVTKFHDQHQTTPQKLHSVQEQSERGGV
jgi:DNA-binding CsgD family transcriptional regulator